MGTDINIRTGSGLFKDSIYSHDIAKKIFLLLYFLYLLFPNDYEFKTLSIGTTGSRFLVLDIFFLIAFYVVCRHIGVFASVFTKVLKYRYLLVLFFLVVLFSLLRGIPRFGGLALGEARWYLSCFFMAPAFLFADKKFMNTTIKVTILAGIVHAVHTLASLVFDFARIEAGGHRFGSGKWSFIMLVCLLFLSVKPDKKSVVDKVLIFLFALALLVSQTRTVFITFVPLIFMLFWYFGRIKNFSSIIKVVALFVITLVLGVGLVSFVSPDTYQSVVGNSAVMKDAFNLDTFKVLTDPSLAPKLSTFYSLQGNVLWRAYAWGQVLSNVFSNNIFVLFGEPLGAGFYFTELSGRVFIDLDPHNDYISIFSKVGVIGLLLYIFFVVGNLLSAKKSIPYDRISVFVTSMLWALLLFVGTNAEIRTYGFHFFVWIYLGFLFRIMHNSYYANGQVEV